MAAGTSNIFGGIAQVADIQRTRALTADTEQQTQLREAQTQELMQLMQGQQRQVKAQQDFQQLLQARQLQGGDPTKSTPAPSIRTTEIQATERNPLAAQLTDLKRQKADADFAVRAATQAGLAPAQILPFEKVADAFNAKIDKLTEDVSKKKTEDLKAVANILRDVDSPESLREGLKSIGERIDPEQARQLESKFMHDPSTGELIYNKNQADTIIKPLVSQMTSMAEAETKKRDAASAENAKRIREATDARDLQNKKNQDAHVAIAQQNANRADADETRKQEESASRIAARSRRLQQAEDKAAKARDPTSKEAAVTGKYLEQEIGMPLEIAGRAAYDYLRDYADNIRAGDDKDEATSKALEFVTNRFTKGEPGERNWLSPNVPAKPPSYAPAHVRGDNETDSSLMKKLDAAGIKASVLNGKVVAEGGKPVKITSREQMAVLPSGTKFIGPDNKEWTAP